MGNEYRPNHNIGLRSEQLFNYKNAKTQVEQNVYAVIN